MLRRRKVDACFAHLAHEIVWNLRNAQGHGYFPLQGEGFSHCTYRCSGSLALTFPGSLAPNGARAIPPRSTAGMPGEGSGSGLSLYGRARKTHRVWHRSPWRWMTGIGRVFQQRKTSFPHSSSPISSWRVPQRRTLPSTTPACSPAAIAKKR